MSGERSRVYLRRARPRQDVAGDALGARDGYASRRRAMEDPRRVRVLYVDGEMAAVDIKFRDHALGEPTENLVYINHELLFERTGAIMNLADYWFQEGLLAYCIEERFTVLFLDNLSTLASGIDENKSIDWEIIQPWLLQLRRAGITVIFVHHAGRNNQMRACPNVKIRPRGLSASIRYLRRRRRVPGLILSADSPNGAGHRTNRSATNGHMCPIKTASLGYNVGIRSADDLPETCYRRDRIQQGSGPTYGRQ